MAIREFEFYHGAVLAKILRKDIPLTLTLIETDTAESWSAYKIIDDNGEGVIYMKYCASPRVTSKHTAWTFSFTPKHLEELSAYGEVNLYLALICVQRNRRVGPMEICLLNKEEILQSIDIHSDINQTFTVFCKPREMLRVRGTLTNHEELMIKRKRIDNFGMENNSNSAMAKAFS